MQAELSVLSFICAIALSITLYKQQSRRNTSAANISIAGWLLACNLVHGINCLFVIYVWCDIVTNFLIGSNVGILAACICVLRNLEHVSSSREILHNAVGQFKRRARYINATLCIALPIIYMCLHILVQATRFDNMADYGCQANFSPSVLSIVLMWLPVLLMGIISLIYLGLTLNNLRRIERGIWADHLATKEKTLTPRNFARQLTSTAIYTCLILVIPCYYFYRQARMPLLGSWSFTEADFSNVGGSNFSHRDDVWNGLLWWTIPALSLVYIAGFVCEEAINWWTLRQPPKTVLPTHTQIRKRPMIIKTADLTPVHLLPSFWEDDNKSPSKWKSFRSSAKGKSDLLKSRLDVDTPPSSPDDESFKASTLNYLSSPIAQRALVSPGVSSPATPPSAGQSPRRKPLGLEAATQESIQVEGGGLGSSVVGEKWPSPPSIVPPITKPSTSSTAKQTSPIRRSPIQVSFGNTLPIIARTRSPEPAYLRDVPFQGSRIPTPTPPATQPKSILRAPRGTRSRWPSGSGGRNPEGNYGLRPDDVIYMTIEQEISM